MGATDKPTIGVLGGGQLARMLIESAHALNCKLLLFTEDPNSPAGLVCENKVIGTFSDQKAVTDFFSKCDFAVFENEFVDCNLLRDGAKSHVVEFIPRLEVIAQLQDKTIQKKILRRLQIPTADFEEFEASSREPTEWAKAMLDRFHGTCVLKWGRLGYDGKGVFVLTNENLATPGCIDFFRAANRMQVPVFAEQKIAFTRELAVVGCRSKSGQFAAYPLVVSRQKNGICHQVLGPATALGISRKLETQSQAYAKKLADDLKVVGCFALEFFETQEGGLIVNEIAPRVHNSGHYTQDACEVSQFENHMRAALDLPLGPTKTSAGFAMFNLLGPCDANASSLGIQFPPAPQGLKLHWYEKSQIKPARKLGHINGTVDSATKLDELCKRIEEYCGRCEKTLSEKK